MDAPTAQRAHYEHIHAAYAAHYYDGMSLAYRRRFMFAPLLDGLDLSAADVADLACGDGHNSVMLLERFPSARVQGFDISPSACDSYRGLVKRPATECDLLDRVPALGQFDVALIVGGLHHLVADLERALHNIAAMLRPGGLLLAIEPNRHFLLNGLREAWYRHDRYFDAAHERPLDVAEIAGSSRQKFELEHVTYLGGPAYFLVLSSLILRVPLGLKRWLSAPAMAAENAWQRLPGHRLHAAFAGRWRLSR